MAKWICQDARQMEWSGVVAFRTSKRIVMLCHPPSMAKLGRQRPANGVAPAHVLQSQNKAKHTLVSPTKAI